MSRAVATITVASPRRELDLIGHTLYVIHGAADVTAVDVSDSRHAGPFHRFEAAGHELRVVQRGTAGEDLPGGVVRMPSAISAVLPGDGVLYVFYGSRSVAVLDISDPSQPKKRAAFLADWPVRRVSLGANDPGGLRTVSIETLDDRTWTYILVGGLPPVPSAGSPPLRPLQREETEEAIKAARQAMAAIEAGRQAMANEAARQAAKPRHSNKPPVPPEAKALMALGIIAAIGGAVMAPLSLIGNDSDTPHVTFSGTLLGVGLGLHFVVAPALIIGGSVWRSPAQQLTLSPGSRGLTFSGQF